MSGVGKVATSGGAAKPGLFDFAGRAATWWLDELRAAVPARLKARAAGRKALIHALLLPDGRVAADLCGDGRLPGEAEALEIGPALVERLQVLSSRARGRSVRLSVPRDACLLRRSRLARRALPHAGAILRHEAEALLPLAPRDILSDWYVETEDAAAGEIHLVQAVLARPRIQAAEDALAAAGLRLVSLTVGEGEGRPIPVDLLAAREPSLRAALLSLPHSAKLLLAGAVCLVFCASWIADARQEAALDAAAMARAALPKPTATALSAAAVADFLDAQTRRVPLAALLDEIARRMPRGASLSHVALDGDRLTLGIEGRDAALARAAFSASPLFETGAATDTAGILVLRVRPLPDPILSPGDAQEAPR